MAEMSNGIVIKHETRLCKVVEKIQPEKIKFIDEENMMLGMLDANDKYIDSLKEATDE